MVRDNISDFLAKLSNAARAGKTEVEFPNSKLIAAIAEILAKEGYIESIEKRGKKSKRTIEVKLSYKEGEPTLTGVSRISKPSRRIYEKSSRLYPIRSGFGRLILSTPKGIMTGEAAKKANLGGEVLFKIW